MKVTDLLGNISNWQLKGDIITKDTRDRSQYHINTRSIIKEVFPTTTVLEEVSIYIRPREVLFLDFYIPLHHLAVEVHGKQHFEFVPHFHVDRYGFAKHKKRDNEKLEWCQINNIRVIILSYNEDQDVWRNKLRLNETTNANRGGCS